MAKLSCQDHNAMSRPGLAPLDTDSGVPNGQAMAPPIRLKNAVI